MKKKECPACAMEIDANSTECPICGYEFPKSKNTIVIVALVLVLIFILFFIL